MTVAVKGYDDAQGITPALAQNGRFVIHAPRIREVSKAMNPTNPVEIDNALQICRPQLGNEVGVGLFRLVRLVALEDILGTGSQAVTYYAGKKLGQRLGLTRLEDFVALCHQLKIGLISVPILTDDLIHVDVHECVTCVGLTPVGRTLCHFEGGLIAGAVSTILGKELHAREVSCIGGLGDATCGFDLVARAKR